MCSENRLCDVLCYPPRGFPALPLSRRPSRARDGLTRTASYCFSPSGRRGRRRHRGVVGDVEPLPAGLLRDGGERPRIAVASPPVSGSGHLKTPSPLRCPPGLVSRSHEATSESVLGSNMARRCWRIASRPRTSNPSGGYHTRPAAIKRHHRLEVVRVQPRAPSFVEAFNPSIARPPRMS